MDGRKVAVLLGLLAALPAFAADPRASFHASKPWTELEGSGVVLRESWLFVEGTPFALVHAVRTAEGGFQGALFAVEASSGAVWPGTISTEGCPGLETVRSMKVLYRRGGTVLVRLGQGDAARKPFATCGDLYRARDLAACTLRVPVKLDAEEMEAGPDQARLGTEWIVAERGRVDVLKFPNAGLKLSTALRECIGDDTPLLAPLEDRVALAGSKSMLLVSAERTGLCSECTDLEAAPPPSAPPTDDEVRKRSRGAVTAWRAGRRDEAFGVWRSLYEAWWSGPRTPSAAWSEALEAFGISLAATKEHAQARLVLEQCSSIAKAPSASLMLSLGDVCRELGDPTAAITAYERALGADATRQQREHAAAELAKLKH